MQSLLVSYAQNREDLIIEGYFQDVKQGFYVDIGANHPLKHSVTKLLYKKGWRGIHIEPNESLCAMLRFDRPEDTVLNVGVSDKPGTLPFTEYANHGLSTFSRSMRDEYRHTRSVFTDTFRQYDVTVRPLADIFKEQKVKHIHCLKVDVEGYEYEVLKGNDWKKYRPEMICIEANHIVKDWRPLLKQQDYTKVFNDGLNDYYLAAEAQKRADGFSYAKQLLESGEVITGAVADMVADMQKEKALADMRLQETAKLKMLAEYQANWYENAPLRWLIGKTARAFDRAVSRRLGDELPHPAAVYEAMDVAIVDNPGADDLKKLVHSYAQTVRSEAPVVSGVRSATQKVLWLGYRVTRKAARIVARGVRRK